MTTASSLRKVSGSIVALVTPMLDGSESKAGVDYAALRRLIDWHVEQGTRCIGVVGTTGESPTLGIEEHCEVIRVAVDQAAGRVAVMAGCGSNCTAEAIELARYARDVGADCHLQVVPYYNKPTQEGLYRHFRTIAEAVDLPMYLYNVPGRTVAELSIDTVLRLAQIPGVAGIKEASGNLERAQWLLRDAPQGFAVLSGDDPTAVALMLCGGHGNISVTANVVPASMSQLCDVAMSGDACSAMVLQRRLLPLHRALFLEPNPIPVKWAMSRLGLCGGALRLPLSPLHSAHQAVLEEVLRGLDLL